MGIYIEGVYHWDRTLLYLIFKIYYDDMRFSLRNPDRASMAYCLASLFSLRFKEVEKDYKNLMFISLTYSSTKKTFPSAFNNMKRKKKQ